MRTSKELAALIIDEMNEPDLMAMKVAAYKMRNVKIPEFLPPRPIIQWACGGGSPHYRIIIPPIVQKEESPSD